MLSSRSVVVTKKAISLSITILFTINSLSFAQMPSKNALRERSTALSSSADIVDSLKHVDISSLTAQEIRERIPAYELLMKKADREYFDAVKELFDVSGITSFAKSSLSGIPVEVKVEKVPVMFKSLKMTPQEEEAMLLIYETGLYTPYAYGRCSVALRLLLLAGMHEDPLVPYKKAVVTFLKDKMDSFDKSYNGEDKLFLAFGLAVLGSNYKEIVPDYKDNIRSTLKTYRKSENIYYNMLSNTGLAILDGNLTADYIADILPKLDNALKKDDQDGKLLSAVIVAALGSVDEVILKTRRRDLLRVFKHVQYNSSKHDHLLSVIGLAAQSNKDSVSLFIKDSIANYDIDSESQGNSDYNLLLLLTGNSKDDKLLLALGLAVLGKNNKKILAEYQDMIRSILKSYRTSKNTHYKIFSNIGLGILDGNLTSDYIAGILLELKDDLENGDADSKLLSAVSIAILSRIEGVIHSKYRGRILSILKAALTSTGNYSYFSTRPDNGNHANQGYTYLLSVIGLTALSEEVESLYRITIEYPGTQKTDTIFGKDAYELVYSLTQTIPKELGISFTALSDKNLKLLLKEDPAIETTGLDSLIPSGPMIADIDHKDMLESALSYTLSSAVETAKSSSGGTVEVSNRELNMVRERITDLMGKDGVRSTNSLTRAHARESLSRYDREIVTPLIGEHLSTSAQRLKEDMENAHSAAVDILEVSFQLWDAFYQAQERYHRAVISDIDKLIAAEDIANPPDKSLPTDKLDMSTILELNYLRQRIPYLLGKWGFRSTDPLKQRIAVSDLFLLNTMIANLGIDEQLSPKEKAFKAHIKNEAARFTLANRADYRSFPQEEYSRSIKGYYYGVVKIIDGIIDGESSVLNPRSSSAGISVKADNLELGSIDETINFLTSDKGLRSTRLLTRLAAAKALVIFDKEVIAPYMDKILTVLTGTDGLNNSDQWIRSGAAVALSRFGETVLLRYTVDINKIRT
ncbi:MAG: hypothetical protein RAP41_02560, partial [Candidatus Orphnella occulta]|nr:hypothetical protein [Candidatus Orphnella occulta]